MTHVYHEGLDNYVASAILHTGCPECEDRGLSLAGALDAFDRERAERLWKRAATAYDNGYALPGEDGPADAILLDPLEVHLVHTVQAVQRALQREVRAEASREEDTLPALAVMPAWVAQTRPPRAS